MKLQSDKTIRKNIEKKLNREKFIQKKARFLKRL